jgi:hypothetical protein
MNKTYSADAVAKMFHEAYERLAPEFGYETRVDTRKDWDEVPTANKELMRATCKTVVNSLVPGLVE